MGHDYKKAVEVLTEVEKNRIVCLYLNCDPQSVDWDKATKEFGAASVDSMRVSMRNTLKKIDKASDKGPSGASPSKGTPVKGTPKSAGKKRAPAEDADDVEMTPKKKRGRKSKAAAAAAEDEIKVKVKGEGEDDGEDDEN